MMVCSKLPVAPAASKLVRWMLSSSTISLIIATCVMLRTVSAFAIAWMCLAITLLVVEAKMLSCYSSMVVLAALGYSFDGLCCLSI